MRTGTILTFHIIPNANYTQLAFKLRIIWPCVRWRLGNLWRTPMVQPWRGCWRIYGVPLTYPWRTFRRRIVMINLGRDQTNVEKN